MKEASEKPAAEIIAEFFAAPGEAYFSTPDVAVVARCSDEKLERDRWRGAGIPFSKFGRQVLYRKADVLDYLERNRREFADRVAA